MKKINERKKKKQELELDLDITHESNMIRARNATNFFQCMKLINCNNKYTFVNFFTLLCYILHYFMCNFYNFGASIKKIQQRKTGLNVFFFRWDTNTWETIRKLIFYQPSLKVLCFLIPSLYMCFFIQFFFRIWNENIWFKIFGIGGIYFENESMNISNYNLKRIF